MNRKARRVLALMSVILFCTFLSLEFIIMEPWDLFPQIQEEYNASYLTDEHLQPGGQPGRGPPSRHEERPPFPPAFRNFCDFPAVLFLCSGRVADGPGPADVCRPPADLSPVAPQISLGSFRAAGKGRKEKEPRFLIVYRLIRRK